MVKWPKILGLALPSGGKLTTGPGPQVLAATSATSDTLSSDGVSEGADTVDIGSVKPIARTTREGGQAASERKPAMGRPALRSHRHAGAPDFLGLPAPAAACPGCAAGGSGQCARPGRNIRRWRGSAFRRSYGCSLSPAYRSDSTARSPIHPSPNARRQSPPN